MNNMIRYRLCSNMKVPPAAKLLYCYLLDCSDVRRTVIMSVKLMAANVGLSKSAVTANLRRLSALEMLKIYPRKSEDGGRLANRYVLL